MVQLNPGDKRHQVDNLVITCSDHRFQNAYSDILRELKIEEYDRIAFPGSSKAVSNRILDEAIIKLRQLHDFNTVHIMDHTDCGGFGGLEAYDFDEKEESESHFRMLAKAADVFSIILPRVVVVKHVIGLHGQEIQPGDDPRIAPSHHQ